MKIHILYNFRQGPWGGGNQFLKALRKEFFNIETYDENVENADVILFNSYPFGSEYLFDRVFRIKHNYLKKIVIHRLDGPISFVRGKDKEIDKIIGLFNNLFVDGIIFQSSWCKEQNKKYFGISSKYETVIHNAPDNDIFNRKGKKEFNPNDKIKLIATSWSTNWRKGFEVYEFLDKNLDFSKYNMTFVGNSPIQFKNIRWIRPVPSEKVAEILKQHDICISASENDPCSNSLIEALSCGLPIVALKDGGHPELVREGGELFSRKGDVIEKIEKVAKDYHYYQSKILEFSIEKVARDYYEFAQEIYDDVQKRRYQSKGVSLSTKVGFYRMNWLILKRAIIDKVKAVLKL